MDTNPTEEIEARDPASRESTFEEPDTGRPFSRAAESEGGEGRAEPGADEGAETESPEAAEPGAAAARAGDGLEAMLDGLAGRLDSALQSLREELERRWTLDRFREEQVDNLHAELQEYKRDLLGRATQPLLQGLIRLHSDLSKTVDALREKDSAELTPERFFAAFGGFREDIEVLLDRHGVSPFETPGDLFRPERQTALRTEPAPSTELVGRIHSRLRPGFEQGTVLLRKEGVAVWASPPTTSLQPDGLGAAPGTARADEMETPS